VVLYEMLAGRPPFTAENPVAVAAQHIEQVPPALAELAPELDPHVAMTCERALAKDPAARPSSAAAFASMLTGQTPVPARSGSDATVVLPPVDATAVLASAAAPSPAGPRGPDRKRLPVWAIAVALMVLGLAALLVFRSVSGDSTPSPGRNEVPVPNVVGLPRGDAERAIKAVGLQVGDVLAAPGDSDVVVRTDPPSGFQVALGSTVTLYVGSPPKEPHHGKGEGHGKGKGKGGD
jgi:hypothetical protein